MMHQTIAPSSGYYHIEPVDEPAQPRRLAHLNGPAGRSIAASMTANDTGESQHERETWPALWYRIVMDGWLCHAHLRMAAAVEALGHPGVLADFDRARGGPFDG